MFMGFGLIFTVLIFGAIVYALGWRPQGNNNFFASSGSTTTALDIAKERYARGELSKEEFEQIHYDLNSQRR